MKLKMHRPALVMNRIGASLIDMFLISVMYGVVVAVMTGNYSAIFNRFNISFGDYRYDLAVVFILMAIYFILLPFIWNGVTLGKKVTRIKLISLKSEKLTLQTLTIRFFVLLLPNILLLGIPVLCNVYMMLFRKDNCGFQDLITKTKVISLV
ncbi:MULTISPECIES: RDD family protein [Bacillus cereus group]|uniref:RDD family protein n=1 Tax=Bacillus cereus group TaxID=86661 RepID=UPI000CD8BBBF|nr:MULTISPECIES: RDD family protein [Bacillus cereus group]MCC2339812.1 RDD family protein [Bacillus tropicus]MCU5223599.1 RDD family protein [Bacillus tropicus]MCU5422855.1 RDD family protein [Bacillus tropicus]MDA1648389.1 RDD family protein [Bacillus cereus group sp. TH160LC]MDA1798784.1 RDD family protein [Bacillus cereus group sp. BY6-1LC]